MIDETSWCSTAEPMTQQDIMVCQELVRFDENAAKILLTGAIREDEIGDIAAARLAGVCKIMDDGFLGFEVDRFDNHAPGVFYLHRFDAQTAWSILGAERLRVMAEAKAAELAPGIDLQLDHFDLYQSLFVSIWADAIKHQRCMVGPERQKKDEGGYYEIVPKVLGKDRAKEIPLVAACLSRMVGPGAFQRTSPALFFCLPEVVETIKGGFHLVKLHVKDTAGLAYNPQKTLDVASKLWEDTVSKQH